ncbi:MAG: replication-relaxation family protein [Bryobacteraceae bacterium]|jgi:hypothetical protein
MSGNSGKAGVVIQERDRRLLSETTVMRIFDRELAKLVAGFGSNTRANTRLLKLTRAGLLNRFFVGTVGGGRKAIYTLSPKGGAVIGSEFRPISRRHGHTLVGDLFVAHQMQINGIYAALKFRPLPTGLRFVRWASAQRPIGGSPGLVPDGYFEIQTPAGIRAHFLEVDLGHQAMKVWERRVRAYLQLAVSGEFARIFRQQRFRVLVATTSQRRLASIRVTIAKQTDKLFWLSDLPTINRDGLCAPIWLRPRGDQAVALF